MRLLVQRVTHASVTFDGIQHDIQHGLCVFIGITHGDTKANADWLADKLLGLRIFNDDTGKINRSLHDINGDILLVSQFSLYASCTKGRRPSFTNAANPDEAEILYDYFVSKVKSSGFNVQCGKFGADMTVNITNDGPLTFIIDSI